MLYQILNIIAPVFLVILTGYLAVRQRLFADGMVDGLMRFAILFAVPCLLFKATSTMDIGSAFHWKVVLPFYAGATLSFAIAGLLARKVFGRPPGEAVAVGFSALFSNLLLLGLPISERAWGSAQMGPLFAIVSLHAPFCYMLGITTMELLRSDGRSLFGTSKVVAKAIFSNSLMVGIGLGFLANLSGLPLPGMLTAAVDILAKAALPAALFALGGVLTRYRLSDSLGEVSLITVVSLFVHPLLALLLCRLLEVDMAATRMVVLMAAMPPGLNSYLFATLYQRGQATAASTVLVATLVSVFSASLWLWWMM